MTKYALSHDVRQNHTIFDLSAALDMVNFGSPGNADTMHACEAQETPAFAAQSDSFR